MGAGENVYLITHNRLVGFVDGILVSWSLCEFTLFPGRKQLMGCISYKGNEIRTNRKPPNEYGQDSRC